MNPLTPEQEQAFFAQNQRHWDQKTPGHLQSDFYQLEAFKKGWNSLKPPELAAMGDVSGKSLLHLQCHFGQDTLSWARMGAKPTGVDLSEVAIATARELARELSLEADFVASNLYDLPQHMAGEFDIVFTSYGTIGWLPDLERWAKVVAHFLKPGGSFYMIDFHPFLWMHDEHFTKLSYSYFNRGPIIEESGISYAELEKRDSESEIGWNHSLGAILSALISQGIHINQVEELPFSSYNCFPGMKEIAPDQWIIEVFEVEVPHMYAIQGTTVRNAG